MSTLQHVAELLEDGEGPELHELLTEKLPRLSAEDRRALGVIVRWAYINQPELRPLRVPDQVQQQPRRWTERWHGSGPDRGWWVYEANHGDSIAYFGEGEFANRLCSLVVQKHNEALAAQAAPAQAVAPINMILHCPKCGMQHIDRPETEAEYAARLHESSWRELGGDKPARWTNGSHRSHLCHNPKCRTVWRPADVPTNGVAAIQSRGTDDTWPEVSPTAG
jgi:hypothetical protein